LMMVCCRCAYKHACISVLLTRLLVAGGLECRGRVVRVESTAHIPPGISCYQNIVLLIETLIKLFWNFWAKWTVRSNKGIHSKKGCY
jgi:hypothetical protein